MKKWLVYLEGGPYDGKVFDTRYILGKPDQLPGIDDYVWTSKRVSKDDKSAQVWRYEGSKVD
jgi:hypothetical protein